MTYVILFCVVFLGLLTVVALIVAGVKLICYIDEKYGDTAAGVSLIVIASFAVAACVTLAEYGSRNL